MKINYTAILLLILFAAVIVSKNVKQNAESLADFKVSHYSPEVFMSFTIVGDDGGDELQTISGTTSPAITTLSTSGGAIQITGTGIIK